VAELIALDGPVIDQALYDAYADDFRAEIEDVCQLRRRL